MRKFIAAAGICLMGAPAFGAEVFFSGYTNATVLTPVPPPNTSSPQTFTVAALSYGNSTFSGNSTGGFLALGGVASAPSGPQNVNNLGSFSLGSSAVNYNGIIFDLRTTFTAPTGIAGTNSPVLSANIIGSVVNSSTGGVFIDFNNTPIPFTFNNGVTVGSFSFTVNDVSVSPGATAVPLTGHITAAQQQPVPEPSTLAVVGLIGAAATLRRRR